MVVEYVRVCVLCAVCYVRVRVSVCDGGETARPRAWRSAPEVPVWRGRGLSNVVCEHASLGKRLCAWRREWRGERTKVDCVRL